MNKKFILALGLCCLSGLVLADLTSTVNDAATQLGISEKTLFEPSIADLSVSYLGMIFGTVGNVVMGANGQFIGEIFKIFNLGLLVFAGGFVSYSAVTTVLNASQDGGPAGSKANAWVPFRLVTGVSLLIPMYSGYSMIQVIVMWAVVQGVGLADTMWDKAVDVIKDTSGAVFSGPRRNDVVAIQKILGQKTDPVKGVLTINENNSGSDTHSVFYGALCAAARQKNTLIQQQQQQNAAQSAASSQQGSRTMLPINLNAGTVNYGMRTGQVCYDRQCGASDAECLQKQQGQFCFGSASEPTQCGLFQASVKRVTTISQNVISDNDKIERARVAAFAMAEQLFTQVSQIFQTAYSDAVHHVDNETILCAKQSQGGLLQNACQPSDDLLSGATVFYNLVRPILLNADDSGFKTDWVTGAKSTGWIAAASHYHDMVGTNTLSNQKKLPTINIDAVNKTLPSVQQTFVINPNGWDQNVKSAFETIVNAMVNYDTVNAFMLAARLKANNMQEVATDDGNKIVIKNSLVAPLDTIIRQVLQTFLYSGSGAYGSGAFQAHSMAFSNIDLTLASTNIRVMMAYVMASLVGVDMLSNGAWADGKGNGGFLASRHTNILGMSVDTPAVNLGKCGDATVFAACSGQRPTASSVTLSKLSEIMASVAQTCNVANWLNKNLSSGVMTSKCLTTYSVENCKNESYQNAHNDTSMDACTAMGVENAQQALAALDNAIDRYNSYDNAQCPQVALDKGCIKPGVGIIGGMLARAQGDRVDPLFHLSHLGLTMLNTAVSYYIETTNGIYRISKQLVIDYTAVIASTGAVSGLLSSIGGFAGSAATIAGGMVETVMKLLYSFDKEGLSLYLPLGASIAGVFFVLGLILGIYLPLMPFLIYVFTVIGWLIAVIEAMVAAPLVALGVTHPQGHDLLGKSEQAVILLLGIFVRPAAILLGFIFAITLLYIAAELVNYGFIMTIANYLATSLSGHPVSDSVYIKSIVVGGMLIAYAYIMMEVVEQVFGLIYQVPEKLLRWIGAAPESSGVGQRLGQIKQGMQSAVSQASQGAAQTAGKAPSFSPGSVTQSDYKLEKKSKKSDTGRGSTGNRQPELGDGDEKK